MIIFYILFVGFFSEVSFSVILPPSRSELMKEKSKEKKDAIKKKQEKIKTKKPEEIKKKPQVKNLEKIIEKTDSKVEDIKLENVKDVELKKIYKNKLYEKQYKTTTLIYISEDHWYLKIPKNIKNPYVAIAKIEGDLIVLTNFSKINVKESLKKSVELINTNNNKKAIILKKQIKKTKRKAFILRKVKNGFDVLISDKIEKQKVNENVYKNKFKIKGLNCHREKYNIIHPRFINKWHFFFCKNYKKYIKINDRPELTGSYSQGAIVFKPNFNDISFEYSNKIITFKRPMGFVSTKPNNRLLIEKTYIPISKLSNEEFTSLKFKIYQNGKFDDIEKRMKLIGHYFYNGQGIEAYTELKLLTDIIPAIIFDPSYAMYMDVASTLSNDINLKKEAAYQEKKQGAMLNSAETVLWRSLDKLKINDVEEVDDIPLSTLIISSIISQYPERLKNIALKLILKYATFHKKEELLDELLSEKYRPTIESDREVFDFYSAKNLKKKEKWQKAHDIFKGINQYSKNLKLLTMSQLERIRIEKEKKLLKPKIIINKLERLSKNWRGDRLGFEILSELSNMYESMDMKFKSLDANIRILEDYKEFINSEKKKEKISEMFLNILNSGKEKTPLKIISFYNRVRKYLTHSSYTDKIMESVISNMKNLNLLSDAASLSQAYSKNFRENEKISYWLFKAAEIHWMNGEPLQAIKSMESVKDFLSKKSFFNHLLGKCYFDAGEFKKSFEKFNLVTEINHIWDWFYCAIDNKDYEQALKALNRILLKDSKNEKAIYQLAVVYAIQDNKKMSREIREKYLSLMDKTDKKKKFRSITSVSDEIKTLFKSNIKKIIKETEDLEEVSRKAINEK